MSLAATALVLAAALTHATWNALAKRSGDPLSFLWAASVLALPIYALPAGIALARTGWPGRAAWLFVALSAVFHVAYYLGLARAYERSDLSVAYPVARGTGLMLAPMLAAPIFGDRPTPVAWLGIATVIAGIVWLHAPALKRAAAEGGIGGVLLGPATLTGVVIAAYSLNDSAGVHRMNPLVYLYATFILMVVAIAPIVLGSGRRSSLALTAGDRRSIIAGGIGIFGAYVIVLAALRLAPVSYVVPMRELSIAFGALIGMRFLGERPGRRRLAACALVACGVVTIGLGG